MDVYFDNVGVSFQSPLLRAGYILLSVKTFQGETLDIMLGRLKQGGVSIACGAISNYNAQQPSVLKSTSQHHLLTRRIQQSSTNIPPRLFPSNNDAPVDPRLHHTRLRAAFRRGDRPVHQVAAGRQAQDLRRERAGRQHAICQYPQDVVEVIRWWKYWETSHEDRLGQCSLNAWLISSNKD